jgi:hypothetical protein
MSILRTVSYESRFRLTPPRAIASCASLNSIPISFSAVCNISLVIRGGGVGEGEGEGVGTGVGLGVCATEEIEKVEAANPATPNAGRVLTNARRSNAGFEPLVFCLGRWSILFFIRTPYYLIIVLVPIPGTLASPYFIRKTFALPNL